MSTTRKLLFGSFWTCLMAVALIALLKTGEFPKDTTLHGFAHFMSWGKASLAGLTTLVTGSLWFTAVLKGW